MKCINNIFFIKSHYFYKKYSILIFALVQFGVFFSQEKKLSEKQIDSVYKSISIDKLFNNNGIAKATKLYYQAKQSNYINGQIKTLYRLAELESGLLNYSKSTDYINILKPLAISAENYEYYINALCIESKNFFYDKNYTQSLKTLNQAKNYVPKIGNTEGRKKASIDINIYKYFTFQNSKIPADSYRDSMIATSKKVCAESFLLKNKKVRTNRLLFSSTWVALPLIEQNRLVEAEKYLKIGEAQLKSIAENSYAVADYYEAKGNFELKKDKNNANSAIENYLKCLKICNAIGYDGRLKTLYPKLAEAFGATKNLEKKLYYLEKDQKLRDSLDQKSSENINEFKQKAYNTKEELNKESKTSKKLLIFIILIILAVLSLGIYYLYQKRKFGKKETIKEDDFDHKIDSRLSSAQKLISLLYEDEKAFYLAFNETYTDFSEKLLKLNPNIKSSDVEFCALIKLNLETKEIASLKKMSVRAVEGKKYRIRKKLNINPDENMYLRISKL